MTIQEHMTLEMENVLSYRGKMTQQEIALKMKELNQTLEAQGAKKTLPLVSATYAVEQSPLGVVMDVEIMLPLDREIKVPTGCRWFPSFSVNNALMVYYVGNPSGLGNTIGQLNQYIKANSLVPVTPGYNVTLKEVKTPLDVNQMEVCVYVGIRSDSE